MVKCAEFWKKSVENLPRVLLQFVDHLFQIKNTGNWAKYKEVLIVTFVMVQLLGLASLLNFHCFLQSIYYPRRTIKFSKALFSQHFTHKNLRGIYLILVENLKKTHKQALFVDGLAEI